MRRTEDRPAQFLAVVKGWRVHRKAPPMRPYCPAGWEPHPDRCLVLADPELLIWIRAQVADPDGCLAGADRGVDAHQPLFPIVTEVVFGCRGTRAFAAIQIILHRLPDGTEFLEIDFDLGNPSRGVAPAALHAGEWVIHWGSALFGQRIRTNPRRVARWMRHDGIDVEAI